MIGNHDSKARVELCFSLENVDLIKDLEKAGIGTIPNEVNISREINIHGKNTYKVNGSSVRLSLIRKHFMNIVDMHSQHQSHKLLDSSYQRELLDSYAKVDMTLYSNLYRKMIASQKKYHDYMNGKDSPDQIEFITGRYEELKALNPSHDDYHDVEERLKYLTNYEQYQSHYQEILNTLDYQPGLLGHLVSIRENIENIDSANLLTQFDNIYLELEDLRNTLSDNYLKLNFDQGEFDDLQSRIMAYQASLKRYGSMDSILETMNQYEVQVTKSKHYEEHLEDLRLEMVLAQDKLLNEAHKITNLRKKAIPELEQSIIKELDDLMLTESVFKIHLQVGEITAMGQDSIAFMIGLNKGMDLSPLSETASGGEMSRFMLALKSVFLRRESHAVLILDEIDSGVSGAVGFAMGRKIQEMAMSHQVVAISHLPSLAACAHAHFLISKEHTKTNSISSVRKIQDQDRVNHLAYVLSGTISQSAIITAQELLKEGGK